MNLAWLSGYKTIHIYGMDSSYEDDNHHAYAQPLNDGAETQTVVLGDKTYRSARWMIRQAREFQENYRYLESEGVKVVVHGSGLIPDMARAMK